MAWYIVDEAPWDAKQLPSGEFWQGWREVTEDEAREHQYGVDSYRGFSGAHPLSQRNPFPPSPGYA